MAIFTYVIWIHLLVFAPQKFLRKSSSHRHWTQTLRVYLGSTGVDRWDIFYNSTVQLFYKLVRY